MGCVVMFPEDYRSAKDVDSVDLFGSSPLKIAACEGHKGIVEMLLNAKAKVDIQSDTAVTIAQRRGHEYQSD
jgi:ankyrin repeat protein